MTCYSSNRKTIPILTNLYMEVPRLFLSQGSSVHPLSVQGHPVKGCLEERTSNVHFVAFAASPGSRPLPTGKPQRRCLWALTT